MCSCKLYTRYSYGGGGFICFLAGWGRCSITPLNTTKNAFTVVLALIVYNGDVS